MDVEKKVQLVLKRPTEEVVTAERLRELFEQKSNPKHYIGFEISGFAHIGTGLATAVKILDFLEAGIKPTIFLADYHTWINKKLGGDLEFIKKVAVGYFKHVFLALGLDEDKVSYVLASELYDRSYWERVINIANNTTLARVKRATAVMGREHSEKMPASFVLYPIMQAADIFHLDVDIAHAGMDQRKAHMLALDVADKIGEEKFVAVHTHLLPSLKGGKRMNPVEAKMSKSKPEGALFVHDSEEEIRRKIKNAYCPEKSVEDNPIFDYLEWLILRDDDDEITIDRPQKYGGPITVNLSEVKRLYSEGNIHPLDLKNAVADWFVEKLRPVRKYFETRKELLEQLSRAKITR